MGCGRAAYFGLNRNLCHRDLRILGRIVELGEQYLTIEIAENVRVKVQRFQVTTLVPKGTLKGA